MGGTACVQSNHVDSRGTGTDDGGHLGVDRTSTAARDGGDDTHIRKRKPCTASAELDRHAGQRVRVGAVDTRAIGKPDQFDGDPIKHAESFKLRSYFGAVEHRHQQELTTTEASSTPRLNATLDSEGSALSTQMLLHTRDDNCRSRVGQVSQRRRERRVRGLEAVRDGVGAQASNEVRGTPDECAGVPIQRRHSNQAGGVRENRARLREPINKDVDDDIKIGVTMLRWRTCESKSTSSGSQAGHRCEKRFSRSREHNSASTVNQCQCSWERIRRAKARAKGKGKDKGKDVKGKGKGKDAQNESSKKAKNDDQRKCFYCQKTGHVKAECRKRLKDLAEAEGKPVAAYATSKRHSNGRAAAVLTARRETHINVYHSHGSVRTAKRHASLPVGKP